MLPSYPVIRSFDHGSNVVCRAPDKFCHPPCGLYSSDLDLKLEGHPQHVAAKEAWATPGPPPEPSAQSNIEAQTINYQHHFEVPRTKSCSMKVRQDEH